MGEHSWQESLPPISLFPGPGQDVEDDWSIELHTKASPTNAYGTIDFQDTATRVCRAKVCESTNWKGNVFLGQRKKWLFAKLSHCLKCTTPIFYKGLLQK